MWSQQEWCQGPGWKRLPSHEFLDSGWFTLGFNASHTYWGPAVDLGIKQQSLGVWWLGKSVVWSYRSKLQSRCWLVGLPHTCWVGAQARPSAHGFQNHQGDCTCEAPGLIHTLYHVSGDSHTLPVTVMADCYRSVSSKCLPSNTSTLSNLHTIWALEAGS